MQPTANQMHFFIGYAVAFLAFGLIGKWLSTFRPWWSFTS